MSSGPKKRYGVPQKAIDREKSKKVKLSPAKPDADSLKPSWRFSTVDREGPFAWPIGKPQELEILAKLHSFDSMDWSKIYGDDHHAIPIENLSKDAKDRLIQINQDDIEAIFSFHFSGKKRIIGVRERSLIKLLWWDPNHEVCPSPKKHT